MTSNIQLAQGSQGHDLEGCNLGDSYTSETADILPNPHFESGVTKIQMWMATNMSTLEKSAYIKLSNNSRASLQLDDEEE